MPARNIIIENQLREENFKQTSNQKDAIDHLEGLRVALDRQDWLSSELDSVV
jgi:hypothetical protein